MNQNLLTVDELAESLIENRIVFQGVHMLMGGDVGKPWEEGEKRASVMVFIGRNLPEDLFVQGLKQCLAS